MKYGLIDRENYCDAYYNKHTYHNHRLKAYTKFDIKLDQAALKDSQSQPCHHQILAEFQNSENIEVEYVFDLLEKY